MAPEPFRLSECAALVRTEAPQALAAALFARAPAGLLDAVPGAETVLLLFDPARFEPARVDLSFDPARVPGARTHVLPAVYDGPDLDDTARALGWSRAGLVRRHAEAEHAVAFLGFAPGFAYLTGGFAVPRLASPRVRVPAGSLAVADGWTGIYPAEVPGGWRLIGRVGARLYDPGASPPALFRPGDRVVFEPADEVEGVPADSPATPAGEPLLRVIEPGPFCSLQGGPRFGLASSGVPAGGAMDLGSLAAANRALGNGDFAGAAEWVLAAPLLEALCDVRICAGPEVRLLRAGARFRAALPAGALRGLLAVEGGLALPAPGAAGGGLRAGEVLRRGAPPPCPLAPPPVPAPGAALEVRAARGPQWERFRAPQALFDSDWTVSPRSDRRGLRLVGAPLELVGPSDLPPEGTAPGAIQVPGDGLPIVLGPDRPVTGGYAKIATVLWADLPRLAQARPGARVRFLEHRWT